MREDKPAVVVTGASGLIGSAVARDLSRDYRIVGLDVNEPTAEMDDHLEYVECDLTSDASVARAIDSIGERCGNRIASVVHLAAYYDFSGEPSPLYQKLTVDGTSRVLRRLQALDVEQFVFSSSLLVMKPAPPGDTISETSATEALWAYPESKLEAERVIDSERAAIPAVVHRIAGVYDEFCHSIPISHQIQRIFEKTMESRFFPGNQDHGQPFIHADDLVRCIRATVERRDRLPARETFLIAEPEVMSYGELQDAIGTLLHGREWTTVRIPKPVAKAGAWVKDRLTDDDAFIQPWMVDLADAHYPVVIDHAERRLDWRPRHRLRDALPDMIERLLIDPKKWYQENDLTWTEELERELASLRRIR